MMVSRYVIVRQGNKKRKYQIRKFILKGNNAHLIKLKRHKLIRKKKEKEKEKRGMIGHKRMTVKKRQQS